MKDFEMGGTKREKSVLYRMSHSLPNPAFL